MQGYGIMGRRKIQRIGFGFVMAGFVLLAGTLTALAVVGTDGGAREAGRADILVIDGLKAYGNLERPVVYFYHGKHTEALAKENKDCNACHLKDKEHLSLKFKRLENRDKETVMAVYHDNCIACHQQLRKADVKSGPVTCGECHIADAHPAGRRRPMQLDKSLHFRHTRALADKCDQCHHQYNKETQALVYVKGEEGACLYCHKSQTEENRISYRLSAHNQCIACHRGRIDQKQEAGPIECGGCHDPDTHIAQVGDVPRMKRNQPDAVLIMSSSEEEAGGAVQGGLGPVAFDHRAHETYNDSCRVCHHADLGSCARCHTRKGTSEGGQITLNQAMHNGKTDTSCLGCHGNAQSKNECIGCHHAMVDQAALATEPSCAVCHKPLAGDQNALPSSTMEDNAARVLAVNRLAQRPAASPMVAADQIPETVAINRLVDQYEAVVMPHRKIVLSLAQGMADSNLARQFHTDATTLCKGCHHQAPGSLNPPPCASCHSRTSEVSNPTRPGLMAAYHQQCIQCHGHMGIDKPASRQCTSCHAQKTTQRADR